MIEKRLLLESNLKPTTYHQEPTTALATNARIKFNRFFLKARSGFTINKESVLDLYITRLLIFSIRQWFGSGLQI
jgi:hypothetical protein